MDDSDECLLMMEFRDKYFNEWLDFLDHQGKKEEWEEYNRKLYDG